MRNTPNDETKTFLVSYHHEGARWGIEIQATDFEDARERLKRLTFAQVDGELKVRIPVPGSGQFKWWQSIKNLLIGSHPA